MHALLWRTVDARIIFALLAVFLFCAGAYAYYARVNASDGPFRTYVKGHILVNDDQLERYYVRHGGDALVVYAAESARAETNANFHSVGHSVGEVLFRHEGLGSILTCADSFEWGCMHQTYARAYAELGPSVVPHLVKHCDTYPRGSRDRGQCQHAVGHGLVLVAEYATSSLPRLFEECDAITTRRPIPWNDGCHAGVIMEFNQHFVTMEYEGLNGRPADARDPFDVCDEFGRRDHRAICVWWAVSWLHGRLFDFAYDTEALSSLGALCAMIPDPGMRTICIRSIGRSIGVNGNLNPRYAIELCTIVSPDVRDQQQCIERAALTYVYARNRAGGEAICAAVAGTDRACPPTWDSEHRVEI